MILSNSSIVDAAHFVLPLCVAVESHINRCCIALTGMGICLVRLDSVLSDQTGLLFLGSVLSAHNWLVSY